MGRPVQILSSRWARVVPFLQKSVQHWLLHHNDVIVTCKGHHNDVIITSKGSKVMIGIINIVDVSNNLCEILKNSKRVTFKS